MENKKPAPPASKEDFDRAALGLARAFLPLSTCNKCKWPVIEGYCCRFCGDNDPLASD